MNNLLSSEIRFSKIRCEQFSCVVGEVRKLWLDFAQLIFLHFLIEELSESFIFEDFSESFPFGEL